MRKRINAYRRLFQRTKNDENLREDRKKIRGGKEKVSIRNKKDKINSWKEYCNVTACTNTLSLVYKLAAGKSDPKVK